MSNNPENRILTFGHTRLGKAQSGLDVTTVSLPLCDEAIKYLTGERVSLIIRGEQYMFKGSTDTLAVEMVRFFTDSLEDRILGHLNPRAKLATVINRLGKFLDERYPIAIVGMPTRMETLAQMQQAHERTK
jgi:hypothetical protein